jgi:tRNA 2-selenouridine synthase SelU
MISSQDLIIMKEQNEQTIQENNAVICEKKQQNTDLEAENRVLEKLIAVEETRQEQSVENI